MIAVKIVGFKKSGKTTLAVQLVEELMRRNIATAAAKCTHHHSLDQTDTDHDGRGDACDPCAADPHDDADQDGLCCDGSDACCLSDLDPTVTVEGCDSSVPNTYFTDGCTIADHVAQCRVGASNQGQFVSCVAHLVDGLRGQNLLVGRQRARIQRCAARSNPSAPFLGIRTVSERQR